MNAFGIIRRLTAIIALAAIMVAPVAAQDDSYDDIWAPTTTTMDFSTDYTTTTDFDYNPNYSGTFYTDSIDNGVQLDWNYDYYQDFYGNTYQVEPMNWDFYNNGDYVQMLQW